MKEIKNNTTVPLCFIIGFKFSRHLYSFIPLYKMVTG